MVVFILVYLIIVSYFFMNTFVGKKTPAIRSECRNVVSLVSFVVD